MTEEKTYCNYTCTNWQCPKHPVNVPIDGTEVKLTDLHDTEECNGHQI